MPRATPYQTSFNAGELSPRIGGRVDIDRYAAGLAELENMISTVHGPVFYRSGTRYVGDVIDHTKKSRLMPFVFSDTQPYVLEFSENKIRIFTLESRLLPGTFTFTDSEVDGAAETIRITDFTYSDEQGPFQFTTDDTLPTGISAGTDYYINRLATTDTDYQDEFEIATAPGGAAENLTADGAGTHTITPEATVISIEIDTTYTEAELFDIQFAQTSDVLYLVHKDHAPAKLSRIAAQKWRLEDVDFIDGPYQDPQITPTLTLTPDGAVGTGKTLTASTDLWDTTNDLGRLVRLGDPVGTVGADLEFGYVKITALTSATIATVETVRAVPDTTNNHWRLGAWYGGNYPRAVTFHEQRLVLGGTASEPQRFDGSVPGFFENFTPTGDPDENLTTARETRFNDTSTDPFDIAIASDNAYSFTIASDRVNPIAWLNSTRNLLIGTAGGIWPAQASSNLEAISPISINVRRSSARGAAPITPVNVDDILVYLSRTKRRVMQVGYSFETDSFRTTNLTALADQASDVGIDQMDYSQDPDSIVWCVRSDGRLAAMTIDRDQNVVGWHRHVLGGVQAGGIAKVESVTVIPASTGVQSTGARSNQEHDQVWVVVRRQINGQNLRYVEFMEEGFQLEADAEDAFHVDAGLSYDGASTTSITGLSHLEGETVKVVADGAVQPDQTVASGLITISPAARRVHVGLGYTGKLQTLRLERAGSRQGPSQGKIKRINEVVLRFDRTMGAELASDDAGTAWDPVLFRTTADLMGDPVTLFSGDKVQPVDVGWDLDGQIRVRQAIALPFMLLSIGFRSDSAERGVEG